jgi:excinuclease ABC subunit C
MSILKEKIKDFPVTPGVYEFIGDNGEILYVGKAKCLKNRVKSYFAKEIGRGPTIDIMVGLAKEIKYIETESEIEAVILEADLIGKLKPKYNIRQKDDKSFLAIQITKEEFPRVGLVRFRDIDLSDKSFDYFGPYPSGELLKKSLRYLRRIFPFRDCSGTKYTKYSSFSRTCLYGDLGICDGPCVHPEHKKQYRQSINYLKNFLRGKKREITAKLEAQMVSLSKQRKFEQASIIRDRLRALEHIKDVAVGLKDDVLSPTNIIFKRIECYDISNISGQFSVGSMVVFENGVPNKGEYRKFRIKDQGTGDTENLEGDIGMMAQVLKRRFSNDWQKPDLLIIDGGIAHLNMAKRILNERKLDISILAIAKGAKEIKMNFTLASRSWTKSLNLHCFFDSIRCIISINSGKFNMLDKVIRIFR